ncbi:MAG: LamG domain-containing protein, partial [Thaumarchaeota archaeon]|nr:LamG domain-containing protein [Nitrososphaerota archaeon]
ILRMGDQGDNQKFYEIGLTSGNMLFRFSSKSGLIDGSCQTSGTNYADGNWHHFAALRTGTSTCQIYVDGTLKATDSDNSCPGSGSCSSTITPPGTWNIGRDPSSSGTNPFNGYLDDIIHWNNYQLTSSQITDMYKTTFGPQSHKITFTIDKVDQNGNSPQNIVTNSSYAMPFKDTFGASWTSPPDSAWAYANYTTKVPTLTISSNERLKFKMTYVHPTNGELSMKLKIDATGVISDKGNSFLQTTSPSSPFSAYYIFDSGTSSGTVNIYNSGPHNAFISFLSRITYTSLDGSLSYGAIINKINSTSISSSQDSPLIKTAHTQIATYAKPTDIPGSPSGNNITPGKYRMYVFLSGYDDTGTIFLKTIYVGVVRVI